MNTATTEGLRDAERRLQRAQLTSDVSALGELLDDRLIFTGPDGELYGKADDLDAHATGQQVMSRVDEDDLRVLAIGDTGVTWFLGTLEGTVGGTPFGALMRYTRTWRYDGSAWRIIAAHASVLDAPPPA